MSGASSWATAASVGDRVGDAGGRLVVGQQDGPVGEWIGQCFPKAVGLGRPARLDGELRDVRSVDGRHLREAVAEDAGRDGQDPVPGRQVVDDGGLETARPGRADDQDVIGGPEEHLQAAYHPLLQGSELGSAMVDHLARPGLADRVGQGGRARDAQVRLETVHVASSRCARPMLAWPDRSPPPVWI